MRLLIIILVVAAHMAAIVLLYNMGSSRGPAPPKPSGPPAATSPLPALSKKENPAGGTISSPAPPPPSTAAIAPASLQRAAVAMSAELARQTKGCKTGIILDWDRQTILWGKDEKRAVPIASLTKMMTALLAREDIEKKPALTLETRIQVTPSSAKIGGSQVNLDPRENFSLDELLKCIMIFSANDAAHLLAEFIGDGKPEQFVRRMNSKAQALGLKSLKFYNSHGLPEGRSRKQNSGSALELAQLAGRLLQYPDIVKWSSTWVAHIREKTDKPFQLVNRNRLVKTCKGVNGMKTGFTQKAGFCVAATCERGGRKVIVVVTGCSSSKARNALVTDLLDWAYANLKS